MVKDMFVDMILSCLVEESKELMMQKDDIECSWWQKLSIKHILHDKEDKSSCFILHKKSLYNQEHKLHLC